MDIFAVLGSLNKVSIFFFVVTLGVLGYELYVYQKEKKLKTKPRIPKFNAAKTVQPQQFVSGSVITDEKKPIKKRKNLTIVLAAVLVSVLGSVLFFTLQQTQTPEEPLPPVRTKATDENVNNLTPEASPSAPLFITPTTATGSSSLASTNQESPTVTAAPGGIGGANPTATLTPGKTTPSPTPKTVAQSSTKSSTQSTSTATPSPTQSEAPTAATLPVAGVTFPQLFILFLGAATVAFSILF